MKNNYNREEKWQFLRLFFTENLGLQQNLEEGTEAFSWLPVLTHA